MIVIFIGSILVLSGCTNPQYEETFIGTWKVIQINGESPPDFVNTEWTFFENGSVVSIVTTAQREDINWYSYTYNESIHRMDHFIVNDTSGEIDFGVVYTYEFLDGAKQLRLIQYDFDVSFTFERIEK